MLVMSNQTSTSLTKDARYQDVARRLLAGQKPGEIAAANEDANALAQAEAQGSRHTLRTARQERIAAMLLAGVPRREVAAAVGISTRHLRRLVREPGMTGALERLHAEVWAKIRERLIEERAARLFPPRRDPIAQAVGKALGEGARRASRR